MFLKIVLFLNLVSLGIAMYIIYSYVKSRKRDNEEKNQDDAM
ncbi:hypothetical protein [Flagellimonas sp.]